MALPMQEGSKVIKFNQLQLCFPNGYGLNMADSRSPRWRVVVTSNSPKGRVTSNNFSTCNQLQLSYNLVTSNNLLTTLYKVYTYLCYCLPYSYAGMLLKAHNGKVLAGFRRLSRQICRVIRASMVTTRILITTLDAKCCQMWTKSVSQLAGYGQLSAPNNAVLYKVDPIRALYGSTNKNNSRVRNDCTRSERGN
jgi:hypothetical protein